MKNTGPKFFTSGKGSLSGRLWTASVFLTLCLFTPLFPLFALFNGAPAQVSLGQPALTKGSPNAVTNAGFGLPQSAAIGGGRVYVADAGNNRVLWWTAAAFANGQPADGVIGQADFSGSAPNQGGLAGPNTLSAPGGVAVDASNNVWVADSGNNRVLRFPAPAANGAAANLALGQPNLTSTAFNISATALYNPMGVAVGAGGTIFVADTGNNRVLKYNTPGAANGPAAVLVLGQANFTARTPALGAARLDSPASVAVAGNNIWVADTGNNRVVEYVSPGANGAAAALVLGQAVPTSGSPNRGTGVAQNTMNAPAGVAVDGTTVWVADTNNSRVLKFLAPSVSGQNADLQLGQADFASGSANRAAGAAAFNSLALPSGVAIDGSGDIWVADASNSRVLRYAAGVLDGGAGNLVLGQKDELQYAVNTVLSSSTYGPNGAAADSSGRIYAADYNNNRVLWWNSAAAFVNAQPADGVLGQADFTSMLPNRGGAVGPSALNGPFSVAVDAADNLWVNDMGNSRLLRFNALAPGGPVGVSASIVLGQANDVTATPQVLPTAGTLSGASGIAVNAAGTELWVADSANNRVLRYSNLTTGAAADFVVGQADYNLIAPNRNIGSPPTVNTLNFPSGVSLDGAGNLWVSDAGNSRVLKYAAASLPAAPTAAVGPDAALVLGQTLFTTDTSGSAPAALNNPGGVMADPSGSPVWVADSFNSRVLRFDAPAANGAAAALVLGQADLAGSFANRGAALPAADTLSYPNAVFTTAAPARYWIADTGNNRLLQGALEPTTALSPAFTGISSAALTASWTSIPTAEYVVVFSSKSDFSSLLSSGPLAAAATTFAGLAPSASYYLEIKLSTEPDTAYLINYAVAQTSPSVTPLAPVFTGISTGSLTAAWTAIPGVSYTLAFSTAADFSTIISSGAQFAPGANFTGLSAAATYYLEVRLSTEGAAAFLPNTLTGRTDPVAATPLFPAASGLTSSGFSMSWLASAGASYNAVLADDPGYTSINSTGIPAGNSEAYSGLAEYTSYYFQVKLSTESDAGYVPNRVTVRTLPAAGHTPLDPVFTVGSATTLAAVWADVEGSTYVVVFSSNSDFSSVISSAAQTVNSASFSGLTPDTSYYLEVKLSTEADSAYAINTAVRKTSLGGAGAAFFINPNNSTTISVSWPYVQGEQRVLLLATDAAFTTLVSSFTTSPSEYNDIYTGLSGGTSYYFAMKILGEPDASFTVNSAVIFMPAAQLFPYASAVSTGGFTINWETSAGYPAPSYVVRVSTDSGFGGAVLTAAVPGLSKAFSGLLSDTMYYFAVKEAADADSAFLDIANTGFQRTSPMLLSPVLSTVSSTTLSASWAPVYVSTYGVSLASYVVVLASDSGFATIVSSEVIALNARTFTGLAPYTTYYLEVKLESESDNAYAFNTASRRTLPGGVPLAPLLTAVSSGSVSAGWTAVAGSTYIVVLASDPNYTVVLSSTVEYSSPTVYTGLAADTAYYLAVQLVTDPSYALVLNSVSTRTLPTELDPALVSPAVEKLRASWKQVPGAYYEAVLALDPALTNVVSSTITESVLQNYTGLIGAMPYYLGVRMVSESANAYTLNWSSTVVQAGALRLFALAPNKFLRGAGEAPATMTGVGIVPAATVKLTRTGYSDVILSTVNWINPGKIIVGVPRSLALGPWNVLVTGGGFTTAIPDGLLMLTADLNTAKVFQGIFKPNQGEAAQLATALASAGNVSIKIYDGGGRAVRTITDGFRAAGDYVDIWDGRNGGGSMCASGVYLIRFECPGFSVTKRVVLVK